MHRHRRRERFYPDRQAVRQAAAPADATPSSAMLPGDHVDRLRASLGEDIARLSAQLLRAGAGGRDARVRCIATLSQKCRELMGLLKEEPPAAAGGEADYYRHMVDIAREWLDEREFQDMDREARYRTGLLEVNA